MKNERIAYQQVLASTVEASEAANVEVEFASGEVHSYGSLADLRSDGEKYAAMLSAARQGLLFEVRLSADIFTDKPNKKFIRPLPGDLDGLVSRTEAQRPILADHNPASASHLGYILSVEKHTDGRGVDRLRARLGFREAGSQERVLRGLIRTFSIGWDGASAECSICNKAYERSAWGLWPSCEHVPGNKYDGKVAEIFTRESYLREVSITPFPASFGTRPRGKMLSEVQEFSDDNGPPPPPTVNGDPEVTPEQRIAELEKQLSELQGKHEAALSFGKRMLFSRLQDERRLTPAECEGEEVKSILSLGLETAEKILSKYAQRPELAAEPVSAPASASGDPATPKGAPATPPPAPAKGTTIQYLRSVGALPTAKE